MVSARIPYPTTVCASDHLDFFDAIIIYEHNTANRWRSVAAEQYHELPIAQQRLHALALNSPEPYHDRPDHLIRTVKHHSLLSTIKPRLNVVNEVKQLLTFLSRSRLLARASLLGGSPE